MLIGEHKNRLDKDGKKPSRGAAPDSGGAHDQRIVALVRFIARRAAEEDYKELLRALNDTKEDQEGEQE
ncbi:MULTISPECIES: hypothetical protein [Alphaproteobacteria]|uniref:hypothetical protein n=1 Tax=Alphaproteobacteria TaxID=28211 RepID=UPI003297E6E2